LQSPTYNSPLYMKFEMPHQCMFRVIGRE
jgi:hypothetical protein